MDNKSSFLQIFEKVEGVVGKLPGGLQKPILHEITPLKELFLQQRPPRLVLTGDPGVGSAGLFNAIFGAPVAPFAPGPAGVYNLAGPPAAGWQEFSRFGRGVLRLVDARLSGAAGSIPEQVRTAIAAEPPDLILFLRQPGPGRDDQLGPDLDHVEKLLELVATYHPVRPSVLGLAVCSSETEPPLAEMQAAARRLQASLTARPKIAERLAPTLDVATFMRFRLDGTFDPESDRRRNVHDLVRTIVAELPNQAKLEMARLSGAREAQAKIAQSLLNSVTAVSGALGAQPIPLADLPFLLTFQLAMVSGIIYISGRELSLRLATEFFGTLGMNVGVGLVLREGARAVIRGATKLLLPGMGNAISGLVAAGGTYAIGRAAIAYYVEGVSLADARRLFKSEQRPDRGVMSLFGRRPKQLPPAKEP